MKSISEAEYQELIRLREENKILSVKSTKLESGIKNLAQIKEAFNSQAEAIIAEKEAIIDRYEQKISSLESQLEWFRKQMFGKKSEKHLPVDPTALIPGLFDDYLSAEELDEIAASTAQLDAELTETITIDKHTRTKRVNHRTLDTSKLEVIENIILPEDIALENYTEIDREITDKVIFVPAKLYIERTIRPRYVLKSQLQIQNPDQKAFQIASLPDSPLPKCVASSSLLTEVIIQKFLYHMPFYRVINKFKELNFEISDSTIGDWFAAICTKMKPLYDVLKQEVFKSDYIQVDESTLRVIDSKNKRTLKGYVWIVRDAISGNVFFHYDKGSRSNATALALLGDYRGVIQSDGYTSYDQFEQMPGKMLLGCLVHARRGFVNALTNDKKRASEALMFFSKLYEIEKTAKENKLSVDQLTELRRKEAYPVLQLFEKWLLNNYYKVLKSSPIGKAIHYTYTLLPRLSRYVNDGRYNPDNNLVESVIRPLAVGRKNWLHAGSPASAIRATMMYSFISSCKAAEVDPTQWFRHAIENIGNYAASGKDLNELLPQNFNKK